ncbi:hypothetical protein ACH5RR_016982 [Cinchona calisaya]|uniref:Uncharacterized protein n=1 Tax=Cinchona calisaya TaxID=153742 RepID=A0ABD3A350_9GENT
MEVRPRSTTWRGQQRSTTWLLGFRRYISITSVIAVELWAVRDGLQIAWEKAIAILTCLAFLKRAWTVWIKQVYRELNQVADCRAKNAMQQLEPFVMHVIAPSYVQQCLFLDVHGLPILRRVGESISDVHELSIPKCARKFVLSASCATRFENNEIQREMKGVPYKIVNKDGKSKMEVNIRDGDINVFRPEEIGATVITKMKESADTYLGKKIKDVIVTVPVGWKKSLNVSKTNKNMF